MIKTKINPYLKYLLKENLGYIGLLVGLIIVSIIAVYFLSIRISENQVIIDARAKEVKELQNKQNLIAAATSQNPQGLTEDVDILKNLIPDTEDYFSIVYALDELSQKTGFIISSYTINLASSSTNKLSLIVSGVGNSDAFLKFLQDYNLGGGRLITTEKIELNAKDVETFRLALNFYNKKVSEGADTNLNYAASLKQFAKIKDKVSFALSPLSEATSEAYPTKQNPF